MYHISKDARARKSANLICKAVLELAQAKKLDNINVSDIQKQSTVSRSTFYRLFDNIMDVLAYMCDQAVDDCTRAVGERFADSPRDGMIFVLSKWIEHSDLLVILVENNHVDILYRSFLKCGDEIVRQVDPNLSADDPVVQYLMHNMPIFVSSMLHTWVQRGKRENIDELFDIFGQCFKYGMNMFESDN